MSATDWQRIDLPGAEVSLHEQWLTPREADALQAALLSAIPWEIHRIRLFGRELASPRLSCWIGDPGATYLYSGTRFEPHSWPDALIALRSRIETACRTRFNSVLANLYRDGNDSMGWHSDDEPELGERPVIASLSLGAIRCFRLQPRLRREARPEAGAITRLPLGHGSLLRMAGETQKHYRHDLPKQRMQTPSRLNLTFRLVHPRSR